jgi:hypothetical protein
MREIIIGISIALLSFLASVIVQELFHNEMATSITLLGCAIGSWGSVAYLIERGMI